MIVNRFSFTTNLIALRSLCRVEAKTRCHANKAAQAAADGCDSYVEELCNAALFTGERKSEVANLKWEGVDFKKKTIVT